MATKFKVDKKSNRIYNPENGLVIRSATEKVVIGQMQDDEFVPLNSEIVEMCKKLKYRYDESLLKEEEEEEEEEVEEEEEEEEEEEDSEEEQTQVVQKSVPKETNVAPTSSLSTSESELLSLLQRCLILAQTQSLENINSLREELANSKRELETLRAENEKLKTRLTNMKNMFASVATDL